MISDQADDNSEYEERDQVGIEQPDSGHYSSQKPESFVARAQDANSSNADSIAAALLPILVASAREVLSRLYPDSLPARQTNSGPEDRVK